MDRQKVVGVAALGVIVLSIALYALLAPKPAEAPATLPESRYTEQAPYYEIEAYYASSTPLKEPANAAAVALMKGFVAKTISQFKTDGNFDHLTAADIKMMGLDQGRKESLKILYLESSSAHTISYVYTVYTDTLGAHGNTDFATFTFDTSRGTRLALADLFVPGADYLGVLSTLARERLPAIIGEGADTETIRDGTLPEEETFKRFFFDNRDFVILFPPYAVAAYASGPQTLRISVSLLASILKSEYR